METIELLERFTAWFWLLGALLGVVIRCRRLGVLWALAYLDPDDQMYLEAVIRSSFYRLVTKLALSAGGLTAVWSHPTPPTGEVAYAFWIWRIAVCIAVICLTLEDVNVDRVRKRLGTPLRRLP